MEEYFGNKYWYKKGAKPYRYIYHRTDGPAVKYADGAKHWYINGKRHREDGPAVEYENGSNTWYINGKYINCDSQKGFERIIRLKVFI